MYQEVIIVCFGIGLQKTHWYHKNQRIISVSEAQSDNLNENRWFISFCIVK